MASSRLSDTADRGSMRKRFSQTIPSILDCFQDPGRLRSQRQGHRRHRSTPNIPLSTAKEDPLRNESTEHGRPSLNAIRVPSAKLFEEISGSEDEGNDDNTDGRGYGYRFLRKSYFSENDDTELESLNGRASPSTPNNKPHSSSHSPLRPGKSILKAFREPGIITQAHTSPHDTRNNTTLNTRLTLALSSDSGSGSSSGQDSISVTNTRAGNGGGRPGSLRRALASARRRCYSLTSASAPTTPGSYHPALGVTDADKKMLRDRADKSRAATRDPLDVNGPPAETESAKPCSPADSSKKTVRFDHVVAVRPISIRRKRRKSHRHGDAKESLESDIDDGVVAEERAEGDKEATNAVENEEVDPDAGADAETNAETDGLLLDAEELRTLFL